MGADPVSGVPLEDANTLAGVPDGLGRLWTPHRMTYINGQDKPASSEQHDCPFCQLPSRDDVDALIVYRGEHIYVSMNLYPYAPGHLLFMPYRHIHDYLELTGDEATELHHLTRCAIATSRLVQHPDGFNIGMNLGKVAGAGIAGHLHQHLVPRYLGDANFMPIIGRTRPVPTLLADSRQLFADNWVANP